MDSVNQHLIISNVAFFGQLILHFDPVLVLLERAYYSRMCAPLSERMCAHVVCCVCEGLVLK